MSDREHLLFSIIRSVFNGNQICDADKRLVTEEALSEVIKIAQKHDLAHLVALGILNNEIFSDEIKLQLQQIAFKAVHRYEKLNYELCKVCQALENAGIPFMPLKGSVLRKYYPEPWMRTSCDIDILVHKKDLDYATSFLAENLKYTVHRKYTHDVSLFSSGGTHLELHFELVEEGIAKASSGVLADVWDVATLKEGTYFHYEMPDDIFYFYHIAHMAKHFENGGCGIRPFIDLWILDNIKEADIHMRDVLLEKGGLLRFAEVSRKLSRVWLANKPQDDITEKMQSYILHGGVYGTDDNRIMVQQQKKGGRLKYAISKIFMPYNDIRFYYPILQKHSWLTPVMQVRRWCRLIFCGHAKRSINELSYNQNVPKEHAQNMRSFLSEIGL